MADSAEEPDWIKVARVGERFNTVTDGQFAWWTRCMNEAITKMGGTGGVAKLLRKPGVKLFTTDDKISISYWYPICSLGALYGLRHDLREVPDARKFSEPLITMGAFAVSCLGGFQKQTLKRYINDLVTISLIKKAGRGDTTELAIALPAVNAWARTQRHWARGFQPIVNEMIELGLI